MLTVSDRDKAMAAAIKMANLDRETNGHHTNAPYTVFVNGTMLKARVQHSREKGEHVVRLQLYQPELHVCSEELSREPDRGPEPTPIKS